MNKVLSFFERIADRYDRISKRNHGLHQRRLSLALKYVDVNGKSILDLGAGTGILYEQIGKPKNYLAVDFSPAMLAKSSIPKEHQLIADVASLKLEKSFDIIFALGLTTYLTAQQNQRLWSQLAQWTHPQGVVVIGYTHKDSWSVRMKKYLRYFPFISKNRSVHSGVKIFTTTPDKLNTSPFTLLHLIAHEHLFSPSSIFNSKNRISPLYSDFLIVAERL